MCLVVSVSTGKVPKGYWQNRENLRAFLDSFARQEGFDSLDADAWRVKGSPLTKKAFIMGSGGLRRALEKAYPEMNEKVLHIPLSRPLCSLLASIASTRRYFVNGYSQMPAPRAHALTRQPRLCGSIDEPRVDYLSVLYERQKNKGNRRQSRDEADDGLNH